MLIVGEKINTSRKRIAEAVEKRDASFIGNVAQIQAQAGAHYIDVNAGTFFENPQGKRSVVNFNNDRSGNGQDGRENKFSINRI